MAAPKTQSAALLTVPEAALLLGIAERTAYDAIQKTGTLAGVKVIRLGTKYGIRVSRTRLLQALGELPEPTTT